MRLCFFLSRILIVNTSFLLLMQVSGLVPVDTPRALGMALGNTTSSRNTTFGGLAGIATRPIALRVRSKVVFAVFSFYSAEWKRIHIRSVL